MSGGGIINDAPSCLGVSHKELRLTFFPQGNGERTARSHNRKLQL